MNVILKGVLTLLALSPCLANAYAEDKTEVVLEWQPIKTEYPVSPENEVFLLSVTPEEGLESVKVTSSDPKAVNVRIDYDYGGYVYVRCRARAKGVTVTASIPEDNSEFTAQPAVTTPFDVK